MKKLVIAALAATCMVYAYDYTRPVEKIEVKAVVKTGSTLWDMVGEAMKLTGDQRYILEVLHATKKLNGITGNEVGRLPIGREIIIPCEVKR